MRPPGNITRLEQHGSSETRGRTRDGGFGCVDFY